jgi:hypothetical protein
VLSKAVPPMHLAGPLLQPAFGCEGASCVCWEDCCCTVSRLRRRSSQGRSARVIHIGRKQWNILRFPSAVIAFSHMGGASPLWWLIVSESGQAARSRSAQILVLRRVRRLWHMSGLRCVGMISG